MPRRLIVGLPIRAQVRVHLLEKLLSLGREWHAEGLSRHQWVAPRRRRYRLPASARATQPATLILTALARISRRPSDPRRAARRAARRARAAPCSCSSSSSSSSVRSDSAALTRRACDSRRAVFRRQQTARRLLFLASANGLALRGTCVQPTGRVALGGYRRHIEQRHAGRALGLLGSLFCC